MASEESWKDKYLREIEQSERQEKQWQAERNTLERLLVRTSLASEGQSEQLDALLAQLREDLRKRNVDVEAWRKLQEEIDLQITLLDEKSSKDHRGKQHEAPDDMELADADGQRLRIARRVGQLLGQLLRQVSLETEAESRARGLQKTLMSSNDWPVLREGLDQVADLVIETVIRNQREFESFLKRLDDRLEVLRKHFSEQCDTVASHHDDTAILDREIRQELQQVSQEIADSQDLQGLKASVSRRLEFIDNAMERFRIREEGREQFISKQVDAMHEKLAAMEAHSESMKAQIRQERERAMTDLLTHLPNREAWQERLLFEYERWQRYQQPLTVGVIDIDLFKVVNDSYGHKAGDRVLQLVARELRSRLRTTDFVARYGGEEFVLLLPETTLESAHEVIEQLREHVATLPFHFGGQPVNITFSAGLTAFREGDTEDSVFDRADRALYQAKDAGRNCTAMD
ncbi:GGDEF domain-containing protein [Marinobacter oulmenensis]|uniref:diguanylate cyclase n=1 Tax=Marinobacter oulmenensis TaxID=643747 RepID=A0A840UJ94_9GAMM|nr:GGDEF domain-containing protein [Marinobacter oulmenensis]MBB5320867.1 diguanylate cyclase [Marinobacter oulmenensis]